MPEPQERRVAIPAGMVVVTTFGHIRAETAQCLGDLRVRAHDLGLKNVVWRMVHGGLVDKARNEAARGFLAHKPKLEWVLYLDGDMQFKPDLLEKLLATAFGSHPHADLVGGYAQLRGTPNLPTIDTGTGTWEFVDPHTGIIEVIRTGGACLLVKRPVFERMQYPWFGIRVTPRPLDAMLEIDNQARIHFDGRNPFAALPEWEQLQRAAVETAGKDRTVTDFTPGWEYGCVGEDSGFADRAKALGFRIVVNTDVVLGHIDVKVIGPADMQEARKRIERQQRLLVGVTV